MIPIWKFEHTTPRITNFLKLSIFVIYNENSSNDIYQKFQPMNLQVAYWPLKFWFIQGNGCLKLVAHMKDWREWRSPGMGAQHLGPFGTLAVLRISVTFSHDMESGNNIIDRPDLCRFRQRNGWKDFVEFREKMTASSSSWRALASTQHEKSNTVALI